jgi:NodT family efflux transporter outer membrane factor (OMF) lipoprotein
MKILKLTVFSFLLSACSYMSPDLDVQTVQPKDDFLNKSSLVVMDSIQQNRWWENFNDEKLNAYVQKALTANLDLKVATQRMYQFEAIVGISSAPLYPQVSVNGSVAKTENNMVNNFGINPNPTQPKPDYIATENTSYNVGLKFVFNLDVWGKFAGMRNAAVAEWKASRHDLNLFYQNLVSQVISSYIEINTLANQVDLSKRTVRDYQADFKTQKDKYASGIGIRVNVELSKQQLAAASAKLQGEEAALKKLMYQFSMLLGDYPEAQTAAALPLPKESVPVGIPSDLLKQREDIKAAYERMDAARERVGVARADFFPSLSLSADAGYSVTNASDLFDSNLLNTTLAAAATQTVFDGFAKSSTLDQRWAEYRIAMLNYQKAVLSAFVETEAALIDIAATEKQLGYTIDSREASANSTRFMRKRYISGLSSYKDLLDIRRSDYVAESSLIQAKKQKLLAYLKLHQAIGGHWL